MMGGGRYWKVKLRLEKIGHGMDCHGGGDSAAGLKEGKDT